MNMGNCRSRRRTILDDVQVVFAVPVKTIDPSFKVQQVIEWTTDQVLSWAGKLELIPEFDLVDALRQNYVDGHKLLDMTNWNAEHKCHLPKTHVTWFQRQINELFERTVPMPDCSSDQIKNWTATEASRWIMHVHPGDEMTQYARVFRKHGINGRFLLSPTLYEDLEGFRMHSVHKHVLVTDVQNLLKS